MIGNIQRMVLLKFFEAWFCATVTLVGGDDGVVVLVVVDVVDTVKDGFSVVPVTEVKVPVSVAVVAVGTAWARNGMGSPFAAAADAITDGSSVAPTLEVRELTIEDNTSVDTPVGTTSSLTVTPGI